MESKALLAAIGVNKNNLSKQGIKALKELSELAETLKINPCDINIELAVIEKMLQSQSLINNYNKEVSFLNSIQSGLKESILLLDNLEKLESFSSDDTLEKENLKKSLILEEKELKKQLELHRKHFYNEDIDHRNLIKLGDECETIAKELVSLQEKSELYGDFPTVIYKIEYFPS